MIGSNDETLINKKCVPCHGGVSALTRDEAQKKLGLLEAGWQLIEDGKAIKREFKFADFANIEDHHPDIECGWGYCRIRFQTHAIGGLHENDFICAAKIDILQG